MSKPQSLDCERDPVQDLWEDFEEGMFESFKLGQGVHGNASSAFTFAKVLSLRPKREATFVEWGGGGRATVSTMRIKKPVVKN